MLRELTITISGPRASGKSTLAQIIKFFLERETNYLTDVEETGEGNTERFRRIMSECQANLSSHEIRKLDVAKVNIVVLNTKF